MTMRIFIIVILVTVVGVTYGQVKPEDVFYTGEHFEPENCRVETYPDWGRLVFLSNDRFYCYNFNKGKHNRDTMALVGDYRILEDTMYLTDIRFPIQLANWVHKDSVDFTQQPGYQWMRKQFPDLKLKITQCKNGQILLVGFADNRLWYAMKDSNGWNEVTEMKRDGRWEHLLR